MIPSANFLREKRIPIFPFRFVIVIKLYDRLLCAQVSTTTVKSHAAGKFANVSMCGCVQYIVWFESLLKHKIAFGRDFQFSPIVFYYETSLLDLKYLIAKKQRLKLQKNLYVCISISIWFNKIFCSPNKKKLMFFCCIEIRNHSKVFWWSYCVCWKYALGLREAKLQSVDGDAVAKKKRVNANRVDCFQLLINKKAITCWMWVTLFNWVRFECKCNRTVLLRDKPFICFFLQYNLLVNFKINE